ncbi:hypothetical protein [Pedobacter sp.]|uniref:hypothetical protein n=1 Tax=Pedobacter sp. TaxID=1411316 RepID=UPI0031D0C8E3
MNVKMPLLLVSIISFLSCNSVKTENAPVQLMGTWQLLSATTVENGKSTETDYTKGRRMIKIINDTHFAFLNHKLDMPKDSSNHFDGGGGRYILKGDEYTEFLDFYKDRNWEGKSFNFKVSIKNDTLIQTGVEKVEGAGVDRTITEKYLRIKAN